MNNKLERHINIRITQEQLDWLDEIVNADDKHETCISTIIRDLIDREMEYQSQEAEYEFQGIEAMTKEQQIEWEDKNGVPF